MGAQESVAVGSGPTPMFKEALKKAARVAQIPTCSALLEYHEKLRPALENVKGGTISKFMHSMKKNDIFPYAMSHYKTLAVPYLEKKEQSFATPMIKFTDAECSDFDFDGGGYRREFYAEFFHKSACDKNLFIGRPRRLVPNFDTSQLDNLVALGIAIVESILNGDCGFPYLHPAVFQVLIGNDDYHMYVTVEDIPETEVKNLVEQICQSKSDEQLRTLLADAQVMDCIGWPTGKSYRLADADHIIQLLANWSTIESRRKAIDSLRKGLDYLGFMQKVKNCLLLEPLFVYVEEYSVTRSYMEQILLPSIENLQPKTNEQQKAKEYAITLTKELQDDEAKVLYTFITGSYDPSVDREELNVNFNEKPKHKLPESRTCFKELIIPVGNKDLCEYKQSFQLGLSTIAQKK